MSECGCGCGDGSLIGGGVNAERSPSANRPVNRERKCADTIGTLLVPWAGNFQC